VHGVRMDERDLEAEEPAARPLVDELGARGGEVVERVGDALDLLGDVVHAGAAAGEEPANGRVVANRR
jgi:hypothetical protein